MTRKELIYYLRKTGTGIEKITAKKYEKNKRHATV